VDTKSKQLNSVCRKSVMAEWVDSTWNYMSSYGCGSAATTTAPHGIETTDVEAASQRHSLDSGFQSAFETDWNG